MIFAIIASSVLVYRVDRGVWFYIVLPFSIFRLLNFARVLKARMHTEYLRLSTRRTSAILAVMASFAITFSVPLFHTYLKYVPYVQLAVAAALFVITVKNLRKLRFKMPETFLVDRELPTVTVAIPARNETTDLEECLHAILASDYPKLEILVLDDCSQDQTAEVIRSFAHEGVRFVQGSDPQERWLAKNQAYQKLYQEASGDLILFCGVDVRLGRHAIRSMVNLLYARNKSMLGILPIRDRSTPSSAFIQPMRYLWEIALPRRLFNRPPVLSTCWIISRKQLKKLGTFAAVSHTLLPEGFFARELVKEDKYSFMRSSNDLEVRTVKSLTGQRHTAIRTLYPKIRRRPENALLLTIANVFFLVGPFIAVIASFWYSSVNVWVASVACLFLIALHVSIVFATDPANAMTALFTFPLAIVIETGFGYLSMIQYEFFTVSWKERNICIPVMHVIPKSEFLEKAAAK
jgi:GT2 family glycosyltransferase